jgi:hypothetical protein
MKILWCWRCKADVPMLDDSEFDRGSSLFDTGSQGNDNDKERMFGPALLEYERITGIRETNPNVIYHDVSSMYGPRAWTAENHGEVPKRTLRVLHAPAR